MHVLEGAEGFPWLEPPPELLVVAVSWAGPAGSAAGPRAGLANGAMIRPTTHPAGLWTVNVIKGVLETRLVLGPATIISRGGCAVAYVDARFPDTAMIASGGRRVRDLLGHPVLDDDAFVVTAARELARGGWQLRFRCPPVPTRVADLGPEPGLEHQQLGRDGRLGGEEAVRDVVLRSFVGGLPGLRHLSAAMNRARIARIDRMVPPWGERIMDGLRPDGVGNGRVATQAFSDRGLAQ